MKKILLFLAIGLILPLSTLGHGLGQSLEQPAVTETTFDLSVESGEEKPWYRQPLFMASILVIGVGLGAGAVAYRFGKRSRK